MAGDDDRLQRFTVGRNAVSNDADGLDLRGIEPHEVVQQAVFVNCEVLDYLLGGVDIVVDSDEPHHVTRDAPRQRDEPLLRPQCQRCAPRQRKQAGVGLRAEESGHEEQFATHTRVRWCAT